MDKNTTALEKVQLISDISQSTVYLMGTAFILGSMFTLFILIVLDWVRRKDTDE